MTIFCSDVCAPSFTQVPCGTEAEKCFDDAFAFAAAVTLLPTQSISIIASFYMICHFNTLVRETAKQEEASEKQVVAES